MKTHKSNDRQLTPTDIDRYFAIRSRLGFTNAMFCKSSSPAYNPGSFSQIMQGKRAFNADVRDKLFKFMSERLQKSTLGRSESREYQALIDGLCQVDSGDYKYSLEYQPPGNALSVGVPNYIQRNVDDQLERVLDSPAKSAYLVGGPKSGKSSLIAKIPDIARKMGRPVITRRVRDYFRESGRTDTYVWPSDELSTVDVYYSFGWAASGGHVEFTAPPSIDSRRLLSDFRSLLTKHLGRVRKAVIVLEDFDELSMRSGHLSDVAEMLYLLFNPSERNDDNTVVVTDYGMAGSTPFVSEYITRTPVLNCASADNVCVGELIDRVLVGTAIQDEIEHKVKIDATGPLYAAFGDCIFLHHAALDKVREAYLKGDEHDAHRFLSVLESKIKDVLCQLQTERSPDLVRDPTDRYIQQFATQSLRQLIRMDHEMFGEEGLNGSSLRAELAEGNSEDLARYNHRIIRFLDLSGMVPIDGTVARFVQNVCQRGQ